MHTITRLQLGASLVLACPAAGDVIQRADGSDLEYRVYGMPDFDQRRQASGTIPGFPGGGRAYCAPTAAANVLAYLSSHTVLGIEFVPVDSWLDYDTAEYDESTSFISSCAEPMETTTGGTRFRNLERAFRHFLPPDRFSWATVGYNGESLYGLTIDVAATVLASPLFQRPVATGAVCWLRQIGSSAEYEWRGGHAFTIVGATWSPDGWRTLQIVDPDDAQRIDPDEPLTAQSPFRRMTYGVSNAAYPIRWSDGTTDYIYGGNMVSFSAMGDPGVLLNLTIAYPTTVFTLDLSGFHLRSNRPTRMEADDATPVINLAPALPHAATDLEFDFVSQRIFMIEGTGASAMVRSTPGGGVAATTLPLAVTPTLLAGGRFGELGVFGMQGTTPTLEIVRTTGQRNSVLRALPGLPDAACYADAGDMVYAYVAAPRMIVVIPRDPGAQTMTYTVPAGVILTGAVEICAEPGTGAIWLAAQGTTGKMFRLELGAGGAITSITTATNAAIIAPRDPIALSPDMIVFASGSVLRVLRRDASTGQWIAKTDSPLWDIPVGAAFDISRGRSSFPDDSPVLDQWLELPPDSAVIVDGNCDADLDLNHVVDGADLGMLISVWGVDGFGDLDQNDVIDAADLGTMLAQWGPCQ